MSPDHRTRALLNEFRERRIRILALAVAKVHTHFVTEMIDDPRQIRTIVGEVKRIASRAVKKWMPGKVWSRGEHAVAVNSRSHLRAAVEYVIYDQGPDAWTWWYRDAGDEGVFARPEPEERRKRRVKRKRGR